MKKVLKKGFTLVELLVVIAILAILATVSIVGYTKFMEKANLSNDQSMIGMINRNLEAEFVTAKPETASEAILGLNGLGFTNEKLVAYSEGYHYAYNLDENKFYLLDDQDNVVYPETCNKEDLWGLYRDGGEADMINGVNQYVLLVSPTNDDNFKAAFGTGSFRLDLNNLYLGISSGNDSNLAVENGGVYPGSSFGGDTESIKVYKTAPSGDGVTKTTLENDGILSGSIATFESYAFSSYVDFGDTYENLVTEFSKNATSIIFKDCIFTDGNSINNLGWEVENTIVREVVFENCTFTNTGHVSANKSHVKLVVKNCIFNNCKAGVSLAGAEGSLIEGNTFNIAKTDNPDLGFVIQVVNNTDDCSVVVKNNTIINAKKFIYINYAKPGDFNKYFTFENNTFPSDLIEASHNKGVNEQYDGYVQVIKGLIK